jgi:membrane protein DedA with SNARE-associated domain
LHTELLSQIVGFWAYVLLALFVIMEGPVATLAGAVASASGYMKPAGVFFTAAVANLTADILWINLGYIGKLEWIERYGRFLGVNKSLVSRLREDTQKHAGKLLLLTKLTLGFAIPALIATGLSRVPVRRWIPSLILGEILWSGTLVLSGYYLARYTQTLEKGVGMVALAGTIIGIAGLIYYLSHHRKTHRNRLGESEISGFSPEKVR